MAYRLHTPIILGYTSYDPLPAMTFFGLNTANNWLEYGLLPHEDQTVSEVSAFVSSVVGTPGTSIVCELCDAADTVIQTATSPTITTGSTWYDWTGFTTLATHRTQYWLRFRNTHGTPASNNVGFNYGTAGTGGISVQSGDNALGWTIRASGTGGAPYLSDEIYQSASGWQVKFSDGSYQGIALEAVQNSGGTYAMYQTRRFGARFTTPVNAHLYLKAVSITLAETIGTPSSGMVAEVYDPTTLVATSLVYPTATLAVDSQRATFFFATPVVLTANSDYRVVIGMDVSAGDVFNDYVPYSLRFRDSAASRDAFPFKGTMQQTYYNGATWADDPNRLPLMLFFLDNDTDFGLVNTGSSGAGGLVGGGLVR